MQQIIAIANQKGGAGKSPTAVHLSFALSKMGYRVLFVDADSQGSGTLHLLGIQYKSLQTTLYTAIHKPVKPLKIEPVVISPTLHLLPAHDELEKVEVTLTSDRNYVFQLQLKRLLVQYPEYNFIVIDTPGNRIGVLTTISLAAANMVIVPTRTEYSHLEPTKDTIGMIENLQEEINPKLRLWGILPNQFQSNILHDREVLDLLKAEHNSLVYSEPSRKTTKYNDAMSMMVDIRELDPALGKYWDQIAVSVIGRGEESA